jgi:DNA-binding CsgD family transcriptional regulator/tetratricopeptide (TPR) repeat protein
MGQRDWAGADAAALEAAGVGARHDDADLVAMAVQLSGLARLQQGKVRQGLAQLDEAMLAATAGELSPRVTGLVYCSVIDGCQQVLAVDRAAQWTDALARWCDSQPTMVSFTGKCMIHRAEILQLNGAWHDALEEARSAAERLGHSADSPAAAHYQQGEVLRLRGQLDAAEQAYRNASQAGGDPQPGLSLLRLAQGRHDAARAAIRRVERTTQAPLERGRILPAFVTIMLAGDELDEARRGSQELSSIAERFRTDVLQGFAATTRGEVALAAGDATDALRALDEALGIWERMAMPYQRACTNLLLGRACAALGDEDGRALRTDAARAGFERLGAALDLASLDSDTAPAAGGGVDGLTARELEVLRRVATGLTNKEVASELSLSVKTVERHLGNIFVKLDVSTRAAATAYAHRHGLV